MMMTPKLRVSQKRMRERANERVRALTGKLLRIRELTRLIKECDIDGIERIRAALQWYWSIHPCSVCRSGGGCAHREPEVDIARLMGMVRYIREAV